MLMTRILSTSYWLFVTWTAIVIFPFACAIYLITWPFDRRKVLLHRFTCFWASLYTWFNPAWSVKVVGREKIDPRQAYIMVANHLSLVDIFVLFRLFTHYKWVSKVENFKIPCIGWNMSLNGYIPLKRGDRDSVQQMFAACEKTVAQGNSVMMFPEGTRSKDGKLRPFKPGAFELALRSRRPILPIVIEGSHHALPKKGFLIRGRHRIRVTVLDELPYESFAEDDAETLTAKTRSIFARFLGEDTDSPAPEPGPRREQ